MENALNQETKKRLGNGPRIALYILATLAALAVLAAAVFAPFIRVYGNSMAPTLEAGDVVVCAKTGAYQCGDVVAFTHNGKTLVRRIIAGPGNWVSIGEDGSVTVDGVALEEPYLAEYAFGQCDLEFPYQVPDGQYFVLGDDRADAVDSRSSVVGCVAEDQIQGEILFRVWPLAGFGGVN